MTNTNKFDQPEVEERENPRLQWELEGILTCLAKDSPHPYIPVTTRDLSVEGAYLLSSTALRVNEPVKLQLQLPSSEKGKSPPNLFGAVVRSEPLPDGKFGLAIRFYGASRLKLY